MNETDLTPIPYRLQPHETRHPRAARSVLRVERFVLCVGVFTAVVRHGLDDVSATLAWELGAAVVSALVLLGVGTLLRLTWSLSTADRHRPPRVLVAALGVWVVGGVIAPFVWDPAGAPTIAAPVFRWSEIFIAVYGTAYVVDGLRSIVSAGRNPALLLAGSFLVLIVIGTGLLMFPRARRGPEAAPFRVALFTATSAACVTGLVVEPTGAYWSDFGHVVILLLFQLGGLGIMTCGAFFAAILGTWMSLREAATLGELLETTSIHAVRGLLRAILLATFLVEAAGAVVMATLWPDLPLGRRAFYGVFHSVSAFCNAGFSLRDESFVGWGTKWQVWGGAAGLIVAGGLGFVVVYNAWAVFKTRVAGRTLTGPMLFRLPRDRVRWTIGTKLVLTTTALLLGLGTLGFFLLESLNHLRDPLPERIADAWFQSVTFRTAGFNTVNHGTLHPATKLFGILLMFIGASPGSTGGGIKTVTAALVVLAIRAALVGGSRIDVWYRSIPSRIVNRALTIVALGMACVMTTTLLLVLFEPEGEVRFLDLMYEATSAFATVGLSSADTGTLQPASQYVIAATMFVGRVGPLTLLIALAGAGQDVRYDYPEEPVSLG